MLTKLIALDDMPLKHFQPGITSSVKSEMKLKFLTLDPQAVHANPVHRALTLMKLLRAEGIPVFGAIALEGVESGTLSMTSPDLVTGEVTYSWKSETE